MKHLITLLSIAAINHTAQAELQPLDNSDLSFVAGQSGLSIDISKLASQDSQLGRPEKQNLTIDQIRYQTSGLNNESTLVFNNIELGLTHGDSNSSLTSSTVIDIESDGQLHLLLNQNMRRLAIGEITLDSASIAGQSYSNKSFGQFSFDYGLDADIKIQARPEGLRLTGALVSNNGNFFYRDDNTDLIASDLDFSLDTNRAGSYAEFSVLDVSGQDHLRMALNDLRLSFNIGAISQGINSTANGHTTGANVSQSMGTFAGAFNYSGTFDLAANGEQNGSGLSLIPELKINCTGSCLTASTTDYSNFINYYDDGVRLGMANYFGIIQSSGITLDFIKDRTVAGRGDYALVTLDDLDFTFGVEDIFIGNAPTSLGKLFGQLHFGNTDSFTNITSATNLNQFKLHPGGAQGNSGLTADLSWNLASGDIRYADDGQYVWFTGLAAKGTGLATLDMVQGSENGLRLGVEDFNGSYRFKGLYIGEELPADEATLKANRQGGVELLYALGLYQSMDFGNLDGSIVFSGGGNTGAGIGFSSDFVFTNTDAGLLIDYDSTGCADGCGLWATNMTMESHSRNGTFDVESISGFKALDSSGNLNASAREAMVVRSSNYGYTDITELKIGKQTNPDSLGSITTNSHANSITAIATGGDPNRGVQGISIYQKEELLAAGGTYTDKDGTTRTKSNNLRWTPDSSKTDHYLEFGNLNTDSFGIQNTLNVDVGPNLKGETGFAVNALTEIQQVHIDYINVGSNPIVQDAYLYNVRLNSNIVATPLN